MMLHSFRQNHLEFSHPRRKRHGQHAHDCLDHQTGIAHPPRSRTAPYICRPLQGDKAQFGSGHALGGAFLRQRRKVFRRGQRLYGLLARVSRTGSAKDRLYPIKKRLFYPAITPRSSPQSEGRKKPQIKQNHILYSEEHSLYNIWYPWLVLDLQTRNEKDSVANLFMVQLSPSWLVLNS